MTKLLHTARTFAYNLLMCAVAVSAGVFAVRVFL